MTYAQLSADLSNAVSDAELFSRQTLTNVFTYLNQGLMFTENDIRFLVDELITESVVDNPRPALRLIKGGK